MEEARPVRKTIERSQDPILRERAEGGEEICAEVAGDDGGKRSRRDVKNRVIKCEIISGDERFGGKIALIPRITLQPSAENLPIPPKR